MSQQTVAVERIEGYHALKMTWQRKPLIADVRAAFTQIMAALNQADRPLHIVVDLLSDPQFPAGTTLRGAIGSHNHPMMGSWLVIGANQIARAIGGTLTTMGRGDIQWFASEAEALIYLRSLESETDYPDAP